MISVQKVTVRIAGSGAADEKSLDSVPLAHLRQAGRHLEAACQRLTLAARSTEGASALLSHLLLPLLRQARHSQDETAGIIHALEADQRTEQHPESPDSQAPRGG